MRIARLKTNQRAVIPNRRRQYRRAVIGVAAICLLIIAVQIQRAFALTTTFAANFDNGTLNANYAFGSSTASTDGTLPAMVSPGYGGTGSGILNSSGTTLKYSLANNLNSAKGEIEFKYQLPWFLGVDQTYLYLNGPYDVSYDSASGYYYIVDTGNHRLVRTKIDGTGWETYGSYGGGTGQFYSPTAIYYDAASEYLYINDASNYRIVKTKWGGTGWTTYGSYGTPAAGKFRTMYGIDYDPATGYIYTLETYSSYDRIVKFQIDGTGWTTYGASGTGVGGFSNPTALDFDPASGYFYVSDYGNNRIVKTQWGGTGWTTYGTSGSGVGQFSASTMRDISYDAAADYIYVSDYGNSRIVKTKIDGTGWTIMPSYSAYGLDYNATLGKVIYTTAYGLQLADMSVAGAQYRTGSYSSAPGMDYDPATGYYYIADYYNNRIIKTKIDGTGWTVYGGTQGSGTGQFYYPRDIDYDPATDYVYIADYYNNRVVKTKLDGSWTGWAVNSTSLSSPVGIDYDTSTGFIYVALTSSIVKTKIDNTGRVTLSGFSSPIGVSYDAASDYMYVADSGYNRIVKTKIDGTGWTTYGSFGTSGVGKFSTPIAITYDAASDYVYVSDNSYRVIKTKMDGTGWTQHFGQNLNYPYYGLYFDSATGLLHTMSNSGITSSIMQTGIGRNVATPSRSFSNPKAVSYDSATGTIYSLTSDGAAITRSKLNGTGWLTYGSSGTGTGNFSGAGGLEYDSTTGYVYVADDGNNRIVKTKMDGTGWTTFGSSGSGVNQFGSPMDIHFDASTGFIYVADYDNHRIVKAKMDGSAWYVIPVSYPKSVTVEGGYIYVVSGASPYLVKIKDQNPSVLSAIASPGDSVYDPTTGYIFFGDNTNNAIVKMKLDGTDVTTLAGFSNTTGLDYDPATGFLYICDWGSSRIVKIKIDGTERTNYGSNGSGVGKFNAPRGISYDASTGFIYVADSGNNRIVKTKIDGTGWTTYGSTGSGDGRFSNPYNLTYDPASDYIYVADASNNRIVKTKIDGTGWTAYGTSGSGTGNFSSPYDISYDSSTGDIYVSDYSNNRIVKTKIDGTGWTTYPLNQSAPYIQYNTSAHRLGISLPNKGLSSLDSENFDSYRGANALSGYVTGVFGNGNWYLSESNYTTTSRLIKTNTSGTDWTAFGTYSNGTSAGQFYGPGLLDYDATTDYMYVPERSNNRITRTRITGSGWTILSTGATEGEKTLFSTNGAQPLTVSFYPNESKIGVDLSRTDNGVSLGKSAVLTGNDGEWQTLKITYDSTSGVTVKINDVAVIDKTLTWSSFAWGDSFYVGNNAYDNTKSFNGLIDDINISSGGSDSTNPSIPVISTAKDVEGGSNNLSADGWNRFATPYFTWTASDEGGAGLKDYLVYFGTNASAEPTTAGTAQSAATYTASNLVSGTTYYLIVRSRDNAGNLSAKTTVYTYRYDSTPPQSPTMVTVDPPGNSRSTHFTFAWPTNGTGTGSDTGGSSLQGYQYRIKNKAGNYSDWSAISNDGTASFTIPSPDTDYLGTNSIEIRAVDNAGNVDDTPLANNFYYSAATTAPRNLSVTPTGVSTSNSFTFDWDAPTSYPGMGYYYTINVLPTADNKLTAADSALPAGPYASQQGDNTLYVLAADGTNTNYDSCNTISGNPEVDGCSKITFSARTPAPGYPEGLKTYDISNRDTEEYAVALKWSAPTNLGTGFDGYNIYRSPSASGTFSKIGASSGTSYIDDGLTKETPYFYQLKSKDNTGQTSIASQTVDITPTGRYTNPPTLKANSLSATPKAYSATVVWETTRPDSTETAAGKASSFVLYGTERGKMGKENGGFTVGDPNKVESHSINLTGLLPSTVYYYQAMWEDVDGNQGLSDILTLTTKEKPEIAGVNADNITLSSVNINWQSTNMVAARVSFCSPTVCQDSTVSSTPDQAKHTINLSGLQHSTRYNYTITTTDIDGNLTPSDTYYFDTLTMPVIEGDLKVDQDKTAPTTTYRFRWTTNVDTTTVMYYTREGETAKSISKAEYTKDHDVTINQLADQSKYSFEASGVDVHGNKVNNPLKSAVSTPQDSRSPSVSNLTIEIKSSGVSGSQKDQIVASWETDELATSQIEYGPGISGKEYSQKTKEDAALTNYHVVIVNELEPSKMYHLRVVSRDAAGNAGYSDDTTAITGKMQNSAIDLIINSLRKSLGWLSSIFK